MIALVCNGIKWAIDPQKKHTDYTPEKIAQWCGMIPTFFMLDKSNDLGQIIEYAERCYKLPLPELSGGMINDDLSYSYPGDSDLYPLAVAVFKHTKVCIFEYGITAFINTDKTDTATRTDTVVRMD